MGKEQSVNLVETAYNLILDRIVRFSLSPGATVSDFTLSREIGISRTPIREAIARLSEDGLIEKKGHKFCVAGITKEDMIDLYDARESVEIAMLMITMQNGVSGKDMDSLRESNSKLDECIAQGDILKALEYDTAIHSELALLSGNRRLIQFYAKLEKQMRRINTFSVAQEEQKAFNEHALILDSIEKGDSNTAIKALRSNIENAKMQNIGVLERAMKEGWIGIARFVYKPPRI